MEQYSKKTNAIWWSTLKAMQMTPSVGKFATNASGTTWWPNLELMQKEPPLAGEITQAGDALTGVVVPLAMFCITVPGYTSYTSAFLALEL